MSTTIKIGHASISENGTANGSAGDSSGKEVCIVDKYDVVNNLKPTVLLHPTTYALAEKSAIACELGCNNANIGYSQSTRNTLYEEANKVNLDLSSSKLTTKCNTDCSAFMTVCAVAGGAKFKYPYAGLGNGPTTRNMREWFTRTGDYEAITESKYLNSTDYLTRGDILVNEGQHTVMVLANGSKALSDVNTKGVAGYAVKLKSAIDSIAATKVTITLTITKIESGIEKSFDSYSDFKNYTWSCTAKPLNTSIEGTISKTLKISAKTTDITMEGLLPGTAYVLNIVAAKDKDTVVFAAPDIIFDTLCAYPTAVSDLAVEFNKLDKLNKKCTLTFKAPSSWGNSTLTKGYRISLLINGKIRVFSDSLITNTTGNISKDIILADFLSNYKLNHEDTLQIGVQPWLKDAQNNISFDQASFRSTQPTIIAQHLNAINKIYLKLMNSFKRIIIYNNSEVK